MENNTTYSLPLILSKATELGFSVIRSRGVRTGEPTDVRLGSFQHPSLGNLPVIVDIEKTIVIVDNEETKLINLINQHLTKG